jgi:hypothetical protein
MNGFKLAVIFFMILTNWAYPESLQCTLNEVRPSCHKYVSTDTKNECLQLTFNGKPCCWTDQNDSGKLPKCYYEQDKYIVYNAAFGKPTEQSSTPNSAKYGSYRGVDGCNSSYLHTDFYDGEFSNDIIECCSVTNSSTNNYWSVDLLDVLSELKVTVQFLKTCLKVTKYTLLVPE